MGGSDASGPALPAWALFPVSATSACWAEVTYRESTTELLGSLASAKFRLRRAIRSLVLIVSFTTIQGGFRVLGCELRRVNSSCKARRRPEGGGHDSSSSARFGISCGAFGATISITYVALCF